MMTYEEEPLESRNAGLRTGVPFRDSIEIAGFEGQSIWGLDETTGSYWASVWRNDQDGDHPPLRSVGWDRDPLRRPECVMVALCSSLGMDPLTVCRGLGLLSRERWTRSIEDRATYLSQNPPGATEFGAGRFEGALWLVGRATLSPASGWKCLPNFVPAAEHIHAELLYASGLVLLGQNEDRLHGAEEAFMWAITPNHE